jgi:RNA polymerase sigma factor (sigma-70 family)
MAVDVHEDAQSDDGDVFVEHWPSLLRYATALVGPSDAEDIVMTVFDRAMRRRRLSDLDNPRGYLFQSVLNEARGLSRRRRHMQLVGDVAAPQDRGVAEVLDVLMGLPVRQRAVIYLHYWEGATVAEIADMMHVVPGAVKRYLFLARRKLKGVL